jgi:hypothetical protein
MKPRPQFSLRSLFVLTAVVAVGCLAWQPILRPAVARVRYWMAPPLAERWPDGGRRYYVPQWPTDLDAEWEFQGARPFEFREFAVPPLEEPKQQQDAVIDAPPKD